MQGLSTHQPISRHIAEQSQRDLLPQLLDHLKRVEELDDGYLFFFKSDDFIFKLVCDWLLVERVCNPFLRYKLVIEANSGPIKLGGFKSEVHNNLSSKESHVFSH